MGWGWVRVGVRVGVEQVEDVLPLRWFWTD